MFCFLFLRRLVRMYRECGKLRLRTKGLSWLGLNIVLTPWLFKILPVSSLTLASKDRNTFFLWTMQLFFPAQNDDVCVTLGFIVVLISPSQYPYPSTCNVALSGLIDSAVAVARTLFLHSSLRF